MSVYLWTFSCQCLHWASSGNKPSIRFISPGPRTERVEFTIWRRGRQYVLHNYMHGWQYVDAVYFCKRHCCRKFNLFSSTRTFDSLSVCSLNFTQRVGAVELGRAHRQVVDLSTERTWGEGSPTWLWRFLYLYSNFQGSPRTPMMPPATTEQCILMLSSYPNVYRSFISINLL